MSEQQGGTGGQQPWGAGQGSPPPAGQETQPLGQPPAYGQQPPPYAPMPPYNPGAQYGQPPAGGYPPPNPPYAAQKTNGLAIASMVLGIVWLYWIGSILALIFGYIALGQIKRDPRQQGKGMAIAGVVLGWVGLAFIVLVVILAVGVRSSVSNY